MAVGDAWRPVLPQLLARLAHRSARVRRYLSVLLEGLARTAPLTLFRLLAEERSSHTNRVKSSQLAPLVAALRADPQLGASVLRMQTIMDGLAALADTPEDRWLVHIRQMQADMPQRVKLLQEEARASLQGQGDVREKGASITARYRLVMGPALERLRELLNDTIVRSAAGGGVATKHVARFRAAFGQALTSILTALEQPDRPDKPAVLWEQVSKALDKLREALQRDASLVMADVSPTLERLAAGDGERARAMASLPP